MNYFRLIERLKMPEIGDPTKANIHDHLQVIKKDLIK